MTSITRTCRGAVASAIFLNAQETAHLQRIMEMYPLLVDDPPRSQFASKLRLQLRNLRTGGVKVSAPIPPDERSSEPGRGPWFLSSRGAQIYPFDLRPHEVEIEDIAHSLSRICRFNGHCRQFYSVAQHSIYVAVHLPVELSFIGLMHDATEAYCGDMIRPIKRAMPQFQEMEARIWSAIAVRFNLPVEIPAAVKEADSRALQSERRDLLVPHPWPWTIDQCERGEIVQPYDKRIMPMSPGMAKSEFLNAFDVMSENHATLYKPGAYGDGK